MPPSTLFKYLIGKSKKNKISAYRSIEYIKDFGTPKRLKKIVKEQKSDDKSGYFYVFRIPTWHIITKDTAN